MKKSYFLLPVCSLMLFACRKTADTEKLTAGFAVQTSKADSVTFSNYKTYYVSDTISLRTTNPNDSLWFDNDAKQLVDAVKTNMSARGYTFVARRDKPDLGIVLTAVKDLNVGVVYPGWWWGGGYWGYWGGCYWGYCGYPPYYSYGAVYTIPTGTIIMDMIDLKNAASTGQLTVIWGSVMSGGLGYTSNDLQLGVEAINQAFTQSAYIQTK